MNESCININRLRVGVLLEEFRNVDIVIKIHNIQIFFFMLELKAIKQFVKKFLNGTFFEYCVTITVLIANLRNTININCLRAGQLHHYAYSEL